MFLQEKYEDIENLIAHDDFLRSAITKKMNEKYLSMHKSKIWFDENKKSYCTKLNKKNVTAKSIEKLNEKIVAFYKEHSCKEKSAEEVMYEQLEKKLKTRRISESTRDRYIVDFSRYIKGTFLETKAVSSITKDDIRFFLESKIEIGISKKNFDNLIGLLNLIYFYSECTTINACDVKKLMQLTPRQFSKSNKRKSADVVWTASEQKALYEYAYAHKNLKLYGMLFMLETGFAISELVTLKLGQVNLEAREACISRIEVKFRDKNGVVHRTMSEEGVAKNDYRLESVLLSDKAVSVWKEILKLTTAKSADDFIFKGLHGYHFSNYLTREVLVDLGFTHRGLHSFRKTYATNLINAKKATMKLVQAQMRHSDIQTTLKFYYKNDATKQEALAMLNAV